MGRTAFSSSAPLRLCGKKVAGEDAAMRWRLSTGALMGGRLGLHFLGLCWEGQFEHGGGVPPRPLPSGLEIFKLMVADVMITVGLGTGRGWGGRRLESWLEVGSLGAVFLGLVSGYGLNAGGENLRKRSI